MQANRVLAQQTYTLIYLSVIAMLKLKIDIHNVLLHCQIIHFCGLWCDSKNKKKMVYDLMLQEHRKPQPT